MELFADLHIHSCLSPCGDDDMTPCNIAGMAKLKGLDIIALTDHNTARNLPAIQEACDAYGLLLVPGMEITTREEVHMLGYFPDVGTALDFSAMIKTHLPPKKNKPSFFGYQRVMNSDDEQIDEEEALLIGATDFPLSEAARQMEVSPVTLQLRYLQTIREISGERNTTTFFPIPVDLLRPFLNKMSEAGSGNPQA